MKPMVLTAMLTSPPVFVGAGAGTWSPIAEDPTGLGPYAVASQEYHLPAAVDELVLEDRFVEYWAVVWAPTNAPADERLPLTVFLHGNHATCGTGSNPRRDTNSCDRVYSCSARLRASFSCIVPLVASSPHGTFVLSARRQYTMTGTCPEGFVVVPQHRGYDYIGERLASHGYIVVSLNANRGINSGAGVDGDARLIKARGALILGHLALLADWERGGDSPLDEPLPFIDWSRTGLFGHSRGGEAARAVLEFIDFPEQWGTQPLLDRLGEVANSIAVQAILEVGAVDYNGRETNLDEPTFDADGVAWVAVVPTCDGDVSHLAGVRPADRLLYAGSDTSAFSATVFAWGTNHNFYSTEWQTSDSSGCLGHDALWPSPNGAHSGDCPECREPALFATMALFRGVLGGVVEEHEARLLAFFDSRYSIPGNLTTIEPGLNSGMQLRLEDFASSDEADWNLEGDVDVDIVPGGLFSSTELRAVNHDQTQRAAWISWSDAGGRASLALASPGEPLDLSEGAAGVTHFVCRLQRADSPLNKGHPETNFGIALTFADGSESAEPVSAADLLPPEAPLVGPVGGPANSRNNNYGLHPILRTLAVPLSALGTTEQLRQVIGLVLVFGSGSGSSNRTATNLRMKQFTQEGALLLANITASALPPLPNQRQSSRWAHTARNTSRAPSRRTFKKNRFFHQSNVSAQDQEKWAGNATATLRWVPHATVLRDHGPAVEVHVTSARMPFELNFTPRDTGLTLCAMVQSQHQLPKAAQVSDLVRFGRSGSHKAVIFTVAASNFQHLLSSNHATSIDVEIDDGSTVGVPSSGDAEFPKNGQKRMEMWVAAGQCMTEGIGRRETWSLGEVELVPVLV